MEVRELGGHARDDGGLLSRAADRRVVALDKAAASRCAVKTGSSVNAPPIPNHKGGNT